MLTVVAQDCALEGRGDEVAALLRSHAAATRKEPGCVDFVASRSIDRPLEFILFERYVDESAFEEHRGSPHFGSYVERGIVPLLATRSWSRFTEIKPTE